MSRDLPSPTEPYRLYAIKYASRTGARCDHFAGPGPADRTPSMMDFYVWAAVKAGHVVVIDTGFNSQVAARRNRPILRCPVQSLKLIDIDPSAVDDVIITHVHYDHAGNADLFPDARFHIQEAEMHYASGRYMGQALHSRFVELQDVHSLLKLNFASRLSVHSSHQEIRPGIEIYPAGGHTPGMQFVRVFTARGWVVLASDIAHFYEHLERDLIFPAAFDEQAAHDAFRMIRAIASDVDHVIPGHDPLVLKRYPPPSAQLDGIVATLHLPPEYPPE